MMCENVDSPNLMSSDIGSISAVSPPKTTLISPSNNMNAAAIPSRCAAGAIASCTSDNITRITTCLRNDDGAEKKKMAVLKCGTMVRRPADGKDKYTKQDIKDLALVFNKDDIHQAIKDSGYGPVRSTIDKYLKDTHTVWPLSQEQEARVRAMTEIPSTVSRSDTDESATRSSSNSSTATNISCAKDTSFQFQSVPSNEVQAISQVAPSTSGIDSMVTTRLDSSASNRLRAVTPENVPPTSKTSCTVEESTTTSSSSSGQKRRPDTSTHTSGGATVPPNNILDNHNSSNKRSKVSEKTLEVAKILCPRFMASVSNTTNGSISIEWKALDKSVGGSTIIAGANILEHMLKVISKGDPGRAASILNRVLKRTSNSPLAEAVVLPSINSKDADADFQYSRIAWCASNEK